ncbi:SIMPL domain-containing protein [Robertkochia aurantiaca]|uniref:SIMPL domain-containing protein n=1 Tax=Robertkochia aurantiaca TaxID=2873700 RepID=UPI001CCCFDBD|nr:SIMPL domain-containing protein [Robertkochia sp. 3YJGBD-33]
MKPFYFLLISFLMCMPVAAQEPGKLQLRGEATIKAAPDQASLSFSIITSGKDPGNVKKSNDAQANDLIAAIKSLGIDAKDYATTRVALRKQYDYNEKEYQYIAEQQFRLHLKDLRTYVRLNDVLLENGVNEISQLSFESSKMEELQRNARKAAVNNALEKAEVYAESFGLTLGQPVHIQEIHHGTPVIIRQEAMMRSSADAMGKSEESIAPGELEVRAEIEVIFSYSS